MKLKKQIKKVRTMKLIIILITAVLLFSACDIANVQTDTPTKVFVTQKYLSDHRVFIATYEHEADMKVEITPNKWEADFTIFIVKYKWEADKIVFLQN